jgi:hypothetical protein
MNRDRFGNLPFEVQKSLEDAKTFYEFAIRFWDTMGAREQVMAEDELARINKILGEKIVPMGKL